MVECKECGAEKKSLPTHLSLIHQVSVTEYREKYGKDVDLGWTSSNIDHTKRKEGNKNKSAKQIMRSAKSPTEVIYSKLSDSERKQYDEQYNLLFDQANRDPVLIPMIKDVVLNTIFINRYQLQIQQISEKIATSSIDAKMVTELHRLIETMQATNLKNMESLNLTKAKKDALNKTPESTPSKVVAAFAQAIKTMTPEERTKNEKDMEEAMRRLRTNRDALITLANQADLVTFEELAEVEL